VLNEVILMKKKHLIAIDLDGTLLNDDHQISKENKRAIQQAIADGHIVVIATGRPSRASIQYYRELQLQTPMVNFNGALVHHPTNKSWQATHEPMLKTTALNIVEACYELEVPNIMAEVQDKVFLDKYDEKIINFF